MSGTLQVLNATTALPDVGVLTVGGPAAVVLSAQTGTMFEGDMACATGSASALGVVGGPGSNAAAGEALAEALAPSVLAGDVGAVFLASGPAPVPEPSTLALLGAGLLSLLGIARRQRKAG